MSTENEERTRLVADDPEGYLLAERLAEGMVRVVQRQGTNLWDIAVVLDGGYGHEDARRMLPRWAELVASLRKEG